MPGLLTGFYASLFTILYIFLGLRVVNFRRVYRRGVGHGEHHDLSLAIRAHANAGEQAPITLMLLLCFELIQGPVWAIHTLGAAFVIARVIHFFGLGFHPGVSFGRFYGTAINYSIMLILCGSIIWAFIQNYS